MNQAFEYLFLRRPRIDYISPPICEALFSSSGGPVIVLNPLTPQSFPTGLILGGVGNFTLSWDAYPGALCYSIYKADSTDPFGSYTIVAECIPNPPVDLTTFGPGDYRVSAITPDGETPLSLPIHVSGGGGVCPPEVGDPPPAVFDIAAPVDWTPFFFQPVADWPPQSGARTFQEVDTDYPPGNYDIAYDSGMIRGTDPFSCAPGQTNYVAAIYLMTDGSRANLFPNPSVYLANGLYVPPAGAASGSGFSGCYLTAAAGQADLTAKLAGKRWKHVNRHENDGGLIQLVFDSAGTGTYDFPPGFDFTVHLHQLDGLLPQPRKMQIENYDIVKLLFTHQDAISDWDGNFTSRTTYDSTNAVWNAPANLTFGGATAQYITNHPTSPTGRGWSVQLVTAGSVLIWRGFKAIGDTGLGIYYRDVTTISSGPDCITLVDFSDNEWQPT